MSDLVSALRREGKRKRDNMRANGIGHPYVVMVETEAAERIEALEEENAKLRVLVHEVTCWHRDKDSPDYNDCGTPDADCMWCANAKALLEADDE